MTTPAAPIEARHIRVSAAVILDEKDRLLLVRKAGTTAFMQPGGKPEAGETPNQTLIRELREELGVELSPADLRPLGTFTAEAANEPGFLVVADVFAVDLGEQHPAIGAEIAEARWVSAADAEQLEIAPLARDNFLPR